MTAPPKITALPRRSLCRRTLLALAGFVFLALLALAGAAFRVGHWLVREDPLEKASAIVVLSGRMPVRAQEAATLYREGWAPEVWITRPRGPKEELDTMGISYVGEEFYSARVLMHLGVPTDSIHLPGPEAENTAEEMEIIAKQLEERAGGSVIIVTTKAHTRRVQTLWRMRARPGLRAIVRGARGDSFDPAHWWRNSGDALDVVRELLGLGNAWAGLPLRPAT